MKKRVFLTIVVAVAVFGAIFGTWYYRGQKALAARAAMSRPPPAVSTATAATEAWRSTLQAVGTLESRAGITVRAEVEGRVVRVAFASGAKVQAGDLLVDLDTSVEEAQLKGLESTARLAAISLARARELRAAGTNAEADVDAADAESGRAAAAVEQMRATIAKKHIIAPFAGRLGITQVDPGQFLNKGDAIVQLEALDEIYADFGLPQQEIGRLQPGMTVHVTVDAFPDLDFSGAIEAVNPRITDSTRNVRVRAVVPNPDEILRPGMFARVAIDLADVSNVIVLPSSAIVYNPYGNAVYVVTPKEAGNASVLIARQQFVRVGPMRGSQVAILDGLQPGDQVVTAGQIKLRNGAPVQVNNTITPSANPAPRPTEG